MKVRWTQTSIRLRITPSELQKIKCGERVEENLTALRGAWAAAIIPAPTNTDLTFNGGLALLSLSAQDTTRLLREDCEGVYFQTEKTPSLRYFIEKDFPCAHPRSAEAMEPETDTFQAPTDFAARKHSN